MSEEFYTVESVADRLKLHPKTVLRLIREGRLKAVKVGRQYRIVRADLAAFMGAAVPAAVSPPRAARVTAIIDIPQADADLVRRTTALLTGARSGNAAYADTLNVDISHDRAHDRLKVIAVGQPGDVVELLRLAQVLLER